jgi:hypothetical protein
MSDQELIDAVLDQIAEDISDVRRDVTAIEEMFVQIIEQKFEPKQILKMYLSEVEDE